jgi:hypothetical protein
LKCTDCDAVWKFMILLLVLNTSSFSKTGMEMIAMSYVYICAFRDLGCSRHFLINKQYSTCAADAGWLAVLYPGSGPCCPGGWDDVAHTPMFLYSAIDSHAILASGGINMIPSVLTLPSHVSSVAVAIHSIFYLIFGLWLRLIRC